MALVSEVCGFRMQTLCERFGLSVRRLRQRHGWSQEELAARADLNRSYVGEIERGVVMPSLGTVCKLARALESPVGELMAGCEHALP